MRKILFFATLLTLILSCNNASISSAKADLPSDITENEQIIAVKENNSPESYEMGGIKIYPAPESIKYGSAELILNSSSANFANENGSVSFDFDVNNYELGIQTPDAEDKVLANSSKGQHIHLIVDNGPYSAHYKSDFVKDIGVGHHVAIAFLSRSYHESIKSTQAHQVFQFNIGNTHENEMIDLNQPMLFYSRPKGKYRGKDTRRILFDFYLKNLELSPNGYSVLLTINNEHEFKFDTWKSYIVEGLPMGENIFSIQLINADGMPVNPNLNSVSRTFILTGE